MSEVEERPADIAVQIEADRDRHVRSHPGADTAQDFGFGVGIGAGHHRAMQIEIDSIRRCAGDAIDDLACDGVEGLVGDGGPLGITRAYPGKGPEAAGLEAVLPRKGQVEVHGSVTLETRLDHGVGQPRGGGQQGVVGRDARGHRALVSTSRACPELGDLIRG